MFTNCSQRHPCGCDAVSALHVGEFLGKRHKTSTFYPHLRDTARKSSPPTFKISIPHQSCAAGI